MSRDKTMLHPLLLMLAEQLVINCKSVGIKIKITDCVRTKEEQNNLSASVTNAKFPYSYHNWGLAFDICQDDTKCPYPSTATKEGIAWWNTVGKIGERLGLTWGGRWTSPVDRPHFELHLFGTVNDLVRVHKGEPKNFFKSSLYEITTPKTKIDIKSSQKKVGWLQTRLNVKGFSCAIDGFFGEETCRAFNAWRLANNGKYFLTGEVGKGECALLGK